MPELTIRQIPPGPLARLRASDLLWTLGVGGLAAVVLAVALQYSVQAACGLVLVVLVVALHRHDRTVGIVAALVLWAVAPEIRRLLDLRTGFLNNDPLSVVPFVATAAIAATELTRARLPAGFRRILLMAAAGFAMGLPLGVLHPSAALYALGAYIAGLAGAILGFSEPGTVEGSALRRFLLFAMVPVALYGLIQNVLGLPSWDNQWLQATGAISIGTSSNGSVRIFSTLNAPGALAPLLGMAILCLLTVRNHRNVASVGFVILAAALALTYVRSAWVSLIVAAVSYAIVSDGRSKGVVFGVAALTAAATLALSPVSHTAHDVVNRFTTIGQPGSDTSASARTATLGETLPKAVVAPLGHGLGTAGEPTKLTNDTSFRTPDDGYLSLIYQVGPVGFLLVMAAIVAMGQAAWRGARTPGPGQEMRWLLFSLFIFLLVSLTSGDQFYGSLGVIFWFIGGQALSFQYARRRPNR